MDALKPVLPFYFQYRNLDKIVVGYFECGAWREMTFGQLVELSMSGKPAPSTLTSINGFDAIYCFEDTIFPAFNSEVK